MQSSNLSFFVRPTHRRQLVKLIVCLEKVQLAIAQYRFCLGINNDELKAIVQGDTSQTTCELAS